MCRPLKHEKGRFTHLGRLLPGFLERDKSPVPLQCAIPDVRQAIANGGWAAEGRRLVIFSLLWTE